MVASDSSSEIDHESERKKAKEQQTAKVSSGSTGSGASSTAADDKPSTSSSPSIRELMRQREDTPSRKRLREEVLKTVGTSNS